ncbi:unnamed protein product [Nippostrongylus brasiliensis]|uniref:Uncharacterized protein n=1 Tax=Nippostrongylus brasiliensis TaxID=27835 RepID=A0A0N4XLU6_NIPBR|nr:unnamed protein product [Nippostrongylus brasiliensis]
MTCTENHRETINRGRGDDCTFRGYGVEKNVENLFVGVTTELCVVGFMLCYTAVILFGRLFRLARKTL